VAEQSRPHGPAIFDIMYDRPPMLVPPSRTGEAAERVMVDLPVDGKPTTFDLTEQMRKACSVLIDPIIQGITKLIATFDPEFQNRLKNRVLLAGGGSMVNPDTNEMVDDATIRIALQGLNRGVQSGQVDEATMARLNQRITQITGYDITGLGL